MAGPCMSIITATWMPRRAEISRTFFRMVRAPSWLECDMLMRTTFMPWWMSFSIISGDWVAGPRVAMILVRRR